MVVKIKLFDHSDRTVLEGTVNAFVASVPLSRLVDIQWRTEGFGAPSREHWSVMVTYQE